MAKLQDIPGWVQAAIAAVLFVVGSTSSCANLQRNIDMEAAERKAVDDQLKAEDAHFKDSVTEIKQMLRDEMERHHPRHE